MSACAQDAQDQPAVHDVRAGLHVVAGLPPSVRRVVLIPSGDAIRRAAGQSAKSWGAISSLAMPATARSWSHLSSSLGWTDAEAFDALFGGASTLAFIEHHEGDAPIDQRDDSRPQVWVLIGEATEATERHVREKLAPAPRGVISGQAVLAIENGDLLVMFIRKPLAQVAGENVAGMSADRGFWWVLVPSSVMPPAVPGAPLAETIQGAGLKVLESVAPVLAGEPISNAGSPDGAARVNDPGHIARLSHTDAYRTLVKEVTSGALAVVIERLGGWGEFGMLAGHADDEHIEFQGLATWVGAGVLATTVPRTPDVLLNELTPESGSTLIEVFQGSDDPVASVGVAPASVLVRRAMSPCVGAISVMSVQPATDVKRDDAQAAWRLLLAQQLCDAKAPAGANASAGQGFDGVMTKIASVFETASISGPARFAPGRELAFDDAPAGAARSTLIRPAIGSFYLRLLSQRAPAWWRAADGWSVGSICAQGKDPSGLTLGDAASIERERVAAENMTARIQTALKAGGASRLWLSRAILSVAPVRQAVPVMFGPGTPPGALLARVRGVSWDAWIEPSKAAAGVIGGGADGAGGGAAAETGAAVHLRLRIQLGGVTPNKPE